MNARKLVLHIFFVLVLSMPFLASASVAFLQTGDVVLVSLNCWVCHLIEDETQSEFSHVGIVLREGENKQIKILEASAEGVHKSSLLEFLSKRKTGTRVAVYRSYELEQLQGQSLDFAMSKLFETKFNGKEYDPAFLWDNYLEDGSEKYYCSEFVAKFLNHFLIVPIRPLPMTYNVNRHYWNMYFNGHIPDSLPGLAPADFVRSKQFFLLQDLY